MADEPRESDLETQDGELLPAREVMSVIATDPSDVLVPPGADPGASDDYPTITPVQEKGDEFATRPVEPPAA